jgi:hypothetical protein
VISALSDPTRLTQPPFSVDSRDLATERSLAPLDAKDTLIPAVMRRGRKSYHRATRCGSRATLVTTAVDRGAIKP